MPADRALHLDEIVRPEILEASFVERDHLCWRVLFMFPQPLAYMHALGQAILGTRTLVLRRENMKSSRDIDVYEALQELPPSDLLRLVQPLTPFLKSED